jgi:Flp pilus assembly pilin Flp
MSLADCPNDAPLPPQTRHNPGAQAGNGTQNGAARALELNMSRRSRTFARDESGAVSAEWVVLVAGVVTLCIAAFFAMEEGTLDLADGTSEYLSQPAD